MSENVVIVLNPGSTSTKLAIWSRSGCVVEKTVQHDSNLLDSEVAAQFDYRLELIDAELKPLLSMYEVEAIAGRGGPLKPLLGGVYRVSQQMLDDLRTARFANHASNLGAMLAEYYAREFNVPAFIVDPVTVDEFIPEARLSGVPWCERKSRAHALNIKAVTHRAARDIGKNLDQTNFVVAHLGGGISIAAVSGGRILDSNDALHGMGPFSPERAGALPIGPLVKRCFSGETTEEELLTELARNAGLKGYLGTSDVREVLKKVHEGDKQAELVLSTMIYQIAKEIAAMTTVLLGKIDAVLITGGLAHSEEIIKMLKPRIDFISVVLVYPGEGELQALAEGAFRVLDGEAKALEYK